MKNEWSGFSTFSHQPSISHRPLYNIFPKDFFSRWKLFSFWSSPLPSCKPWQKCFCWSWTKKKGKNHRTTQILLSIMAEERNKPMKKTFTHKRQRWSKESNWLFQLSLSLLRESLFHSFFPLFCPAQQYLCQLPHTPRAVPWWTLPPTKRRTGKITVLGWAIEAVKDLKKITVIAINPICDGHVHLEKVNGKHNVNQS